MILTSTSCFAVSTAVQAELAAQYFYCVDGRFDALTYPYIHAGSAWLLLIVFVTVF